MIAITEMITIRTLNSRAMAAANRIATLSETQDAKGEADIRQFPRSARCPATTTKLAEHRAVMLTAMLVRLSLIRSSSRIVGAIFSIVCAKSHKVMTARTIPKVSLSVPRYSAGTPAAVVETTSRTSHFVRYVRAAAIRACVPTDSVGSITGAKNSEWLTGISRKLGEHGGLDRRHQFARSAINRLLLTRPVRIFR
jgi:hypothetical protein